MHIDVYGASDVGCVRELNEDSFCICGFASEEVPGYCILADGMGGHNAGEVASQKAVAFISKALTAILEDGAEKDVPRLINTAVKQANREIYEMAQENEAQNGMGTTAVVACLMESEAYIANVGDSRAYAYRSGELYQITKDHSIVEELVANGTITREEARTHPQKNLITRALGTDMETKADIFEYDYLPGDVLLLCSDGLSGMLIDKEIEYTIGTSESAKACVQKLISLAKENGGRDNITVICIKFGQAK